MRLEQLYYLIEVSNCRSLSEASERLHISQQALNVNIKTLEKELGLVLLNRTNRGITLTKAGIVLTQKANDVLSDLFKTIYTLQHNTPLPLEDNIEIAVEYTLLSHSALTKNLVRCQSRFGSDSAAIHITEKSTTEITAGLLAREIDIGILCLNEPPLPGNRFPEETPLQFKHMCDYRLCVHLSQFSPLARHHLLSIKTLCQYPIIILPLSDGTNPIENLLRHIDPNCQFIYQPNRFLQNEMIANDLGIAFSFWDDQTQQDAYAPQIGLVTRELKEKIIVNQFLVTHQKAAADQGLQAVVNDILLFNSTQL